MRQKYRVWVPFLLNYEAGVCPLHGDLITLLTSTAACAKSTETSVGLMYYNALLGIKGLKLLKSEFVEQ